MPEPAAGPLLPGQALSSSAASTPTAVPVIDGPATSYNLSPGWEMGELPATVPPEPLSLPDGAGNDADTARATSAVDAGFATPGPHTLSASGQTGDPNYYNYMVSGPLDLTSSMDTGSNELHITGLMLNSNIQDKIYAEIGLVTEEIYDLALSSGQPSYMFNQSVVLLNALDGATPFCAPLDRNGTGGIGPALAYPGSSFSFDLKLIVDPLLQYRGDSFLSINGSPYFPAGGFSYGADNWGFRPPENFSQCRLIAQIYSYNDNPLVTGSITFRDVRIVEGAQGTASPHPWPYYGRDPQRSSVSPVAGPTSGTMKWPPFNAGAGLDSSPALADDGTLYINNTSTPTSLYAVDSVTGSAKWLAPLVLPTGNCTLASPAISNGSGDGPGGTKRIYIGTSAGDFYTIRDNGNAGVVLNTVSGLGDMSQSTPLVSRSGLVYTATLGGFVLCFDSTGNLLWASPLPLGSCYSSPTLSADGSTVYVSSIAGRVYGFNAASGAFLYDSGATPAQLYCTPAVNSGGIYTADYRAGSTVFWSYNPTLGLNWSSAFGGVDNAYSKIAPGPLGLYFASYSSGALCAVDPLLHTLKWTLPVVGSSLSSPTLSADNTAYFTSEDGQTYFVRDNGAAPTLLFSSPLIAASYSSPALGLDGTLYVCAGTRLYAYQDGGILPPSIDCTALSNASFAVRQRQGGQDPGDPFLSGLLPTNVIYDMSGLGLADGDTFYVSFAVDNAAQPSDRALYPYVPINGEVTYTAAGLVLDAALAPYFDLTSGGWTLHLKPGAYNRLVNDLDALNWANYTLITPGGTTITGPWPTNTSASDTVVFASGVQYRPLYSSLAYPQSGSTTPGVSELIYPAQHAAGWIQVNGFPAPSLSEGGLILGGYYDQAGLTNTLQADAYCRFEADIYQMVDDMRVRDVPNNSWIVNAPPLRHLARPADTLVFARGTQFQLRSAGAPWNGSTVTVTPGKTLNSLAEFTETDFAAGTYWLRVLPVRTWDDPVASDPSANVTPVAGGWNVLLSFLVQYGVTNAAGLANLSVQLDGDYNSVGGGWNDGVPGRIYNVPGSPYTTTGLKSATVNIPSLSQPVGNYRFALRITDNNSGAQYTYAWTTLVSLPGTWYATTPPPDTSSQGMEPCLAVINGNPAISYWGGAGNDLWYVRATDSLGTAWSAPVLLDTAAGITGQYSSLTVVNGNPAIAYYDMTNTNLKYIRATDINGATWSGAQTLDGTAPPQDTGWYACLLVVNGNPAISYYNLTNGDLMYLRATNASGTAWGAKLSIVTAQNVGYYLSMAIVAGNPAISYINRTSNRLAYIRATDASGAGWGAVTALDNATAVDFNTSLVVIGGLPAVAYYASASQDLKYIQATNATGSLWGAAVTVDSAGNVGVDASMALVAGGPGIAYGDVTNADLDYIHLH